MFDVQRRFNDRFNYPYVFLSDEPFSEGFMQGVRYMAGPNNSVEFGLIDSGEWVYPEWINPHRAEKVADDWANSNKMYADRVEWRHMVRYWSGPFADHSLLQKYQYMWRLEPGSHYTCDFEYDPFVHIQRNHLSYGFAISLEEMPDAVPSLLTAARAFVLENPVLVSARENSLGWLFGPEFNRCQFLTNFEIVDLNFVRSAKYRALFAFLDQRGGIYYERWTDATVRSLAAAMFLRPDQVHWFEDVGYVHDLLNNCPQAMRCYCDPSESSHTLPMSCSSRWNSTSASLDPNSI
ncbi:glycosyltransferase family 15 protein [Kickxella alabastrina]|uniref:glycosyltransferase family 15 protein n=1 Tax=Kickxella alabastrina TaxID=61397 RepID=UPI0022207DDF|nr:glycosyltransferase family 15 protein [Kickxella alabastrina]KAI7831854.1 glycosyltransferase family 15 protein [Kickxella alabastrina]